MTLAEWIEVASDEDHRAKMKRRMGATFACHVLESPWPRPETGLCHQPCHGCRRHLVETPADEAKVRLDIVSPLKVCFVSFPFQAPSRSHPRNAMPQASLCFEVRTQGRATKHASLPSPSMVGFARLVPREEDNNMASISRERRTMSIYIARLDYGHKH
jgi:hypothetical protein